MSAERMNGKLRENRYLCGMWMKMEITGKTRLSGEDGRIMGEILVGKGGK